MSACCHGEARAGPRTRDDRPLPGRPVIDYTCVEWQLSVFLASAHYAAHQPSATEGSCGAAWPHLIIGGEHLPHSVELSSFPSAHNAMTPAEIIATIKDVVLALAGATTAVVAVVGLQRWRQELHGKAGFEVARTLAKATYRLRDEMEAVRRPLISSSEFPEGYAATGKDRDPEQRADAYAHVFKTRWIPLSAALQDFDTQTLEAEALFGSEIRVRTDGLRALIRQLNVDTEALVANAAAGDAHFSSDPDFGKKIRSNVFSTGSENKFSALIVNATAGIENVLRPHLRRA